MLAGNKEKWMGLVEYIDEGVVVITVINNNKKSTRFGTDHSTCKTQIKEVLKLEGINNQTKRN